MNYMASQLPKVVVFGPGSNCTLEICPLDWSVYKYQPSLPANATFLALFGLAMVMHIYLGIHWRSWWFMAFMISGCIFEMIGYGGRIMLYRNPFSFPGFLIQIITITGAPVFFTAAIYVTLSKTQVFLCSSINLERGLTECFGSFVGSTISRQHYRGSDPSCFIIFSSLLTLSALFCKQPGVQYRL
jgi:hypothetical protein